jgi:uncharacterized membrane protein
MRHPLPDMLKGLAVILMIQVHIMELFAEEHVYGSWIGMLSLFAGGPPAAPVFMVVMGYFVGISKKSTRQHIIRGFKLIGIGFILNIGLNMHLFLKIMAKQIDANPWEYLLGVDILILAGLCILIIALVRKMFSDNILIPIILVMIVVTLPGLLPDKIAMEGIQRYLMAFLYGDYSWSYFPLIPWLSYSLTGYILALITARWPKIKRISVKFKVITLIVMLIVISSTIYWAAGVSVNLEEYYHHGLDFFLWVIAFLILWKEINEQLIRWFSDNIAIRYLKWVGKNVTTFYIVQWLLIGNIATGIYKSQDVFNIILWFFGILLITSVLVFAWENRKSLIKDLTI